MSDSIQHSLREKPDSLAKLPALAQRLGVPPLAEGVTAGVEFRTRAGQRYDVFELVNAILDRVDAVLEQTKR